MSKNTTTHRALFWMLLMASSEGMVSGKRVGFPPSNYIRECGGIEVPYPPGLADDPAGEDCSGLPISTNFNLTCNHSYSPPKLFAGNIKVVGINISSARMVILLKISYACYNNASGLSYVQLSWGTTLGTSYRLSSTENEFTGVGCETFAQFWIGGASFAGCISGCSSPDMADEGECSSFGCCRTPIPKDIELYQTRTYNRTNGVRTSGC